MEAAIIDYGMGNLRSVLNACLAAGASARIVSDPAELQKSTHIILPGVGAFSRGMDHLNEQGWVPALEAEVRGRQKPFLGICLGFQLMAARGTEGGERAGLGWVPGRVERLVSQDPSVRIPHIGWNDVRFEQTSCPLFAGMKGQKGTFYFVHSYHLVPEDVSAAAGTTEHGTRFVSAVASGRLFGTQFHPEKSQKAGLELLRNFFAVEASC